jgi:hypothetical protein
MMTPSDWVSAVASAPRPPGDARCRRIIDNLDVEHEEMVSWTASSCQLGIKAFCCQAREPESRGCSRRHGELGGNSPAERDGTLLDLSRLIARERLKEPITKDLSFSLLVSGDVLMAIFDK